jgi:type I restriction enzyme S subunit
MSRPEFRRWRMLELASRERWALNGGPFGSKLVSSMYVEDGVPVIRGTNLPNDRRFRAEDFVFVSEEKADELAQHVVRPGDLVFTQRGTLGQVGLVPDDGPYPRYVVSQSQMKLTVDRSKADPLYLYYVFRSPTVVQTLCDLAIRTGVPHINLAILRAFEVDLPDLPTQRRIAAILGAYDDLIEVNRRRIAVLEEMARRLFEEWFVAFRFPGHDTTPLQDTPHGPLPQGWQWATLGTCTALLARGIAPKYDEAGDSIVVGQKCIRHQRLSLALARRQSRPLPGDKIVQSGDVLVNSTGVGTLGRVAQVEEVPAGVTVDTHVTILRAVPTLDRDFFGMSILRLEPVFERMGEGATGQTELKRSRIADAHIALPPTGLQALFGHHARALRSAVFKHGVENERLAAARDLLLPRLISGELTVADAERTLETAA